MISSKPRRGVIITEEGIANWGLSRFFDEIESDSKFVHLANYSGVAPPAVTDDVTKGYTVGSEFLDTTVPRWYKCSDNTTGAAVWTALN